MVIAAHGQEPNEDQLRDFEAFLDNQAKVHGRLDERAWSDLAHTLLNMKAFYFSCDNESSLWNHFNEFKTG